MLPIPRFLGIWGLETGIFPRSVQPSQTLSNQIRPKVGGEDDSEFTSGHQRPTVLSNDEPMPGRWMTLLCFFGGACALTPSGLHAASPKADNALSIPPEKIGFEKQVQPLLSRYCYSCHAEKKKG